MVEVFKTNVTRRKHASMLLHRIHEAFNNCKANFDLDDCDRILRVVYIDGIPGNEQLIDLIKTVGFHAEVLPDTVPTSRQGLVRDINDDQLYKAI